METQPTFADLLTQHVDQDGRYARQLAAATAARFGQGQKVSHSSISRWLRGAAQKPRNWVDIVKLSVVLQLSQDELHQLLDAAGHSVPHLLAIEPPIPGLFDLWQEPEASVLSPFQAPPKPAVFVGRTGLQVSLERFFGSQGQSRVCCLLGMAGLGKTSLAIQLAYQLKEQFSDGVLWLNLAQIDLLAAQQTIAQAYGEDFTDYPDISSRSSKLRELLANKNALLVLDHVQNDAQLRALLPPSGGCAVLITSRRHDLAVMGTAYRLTLSPLNAEKAEGMALFRRLLSQQMTRDETETLEPLADWLGLHPLALTIAAQRLRHEPGWTAANLLARLQQAARPLDLLKWGDESVRASLTTSYEALTPAAQTILALLGRFSSSFIPGHVAAVAERPLLEVEDSLRQLYNQSLLTFNHQQRYELHPLLRHFCQELPQEAAWLHRFMVHFASLAARSDTASAEQPHILVAIGLAEWLGLDGVLVTAITDFIPHLQRTGQHELANDLLGRAEQVARHQENLPGLTRILHQLGFTAMKQGNPDKADSYYQEALALAQSLGDTTQTAEILHKLSALAYRRGRYEETEQFCQEALVLAREVENHHLMASLLTNLGLVEGVNGRFKEAIGHYEEALALARQGDDKGLIINILQNLGLVHEQQGNYAQAKEPYEEGLRLAKAVKDPELRSRMLGNLGAVACHLGNYAEATGYFQQGLALAEKNGLFIQQYRQQANLGEAAMLRGQFREANSHYRQALILVRERDFPEDLSIILNNAGENFLRQDAYQEAEDCFREALHLAEEHGFRQVGPLSLFGLARLASIRKDFVEARALGEQSRQQLVVIGHRKAQEVRWWLQELPPAAPEASND